MNGIMSGFHDSADFSNLRAVRAGLQTPAFP